MDEKVDKVTVVIPAYNEEKGLPKVIDEIPKDIVHEIIVVDNASTDGTYEIAKNLGIKVIRHEKNLGKVASIHTGIKNAKGEIIVLIDADYTYPAGNIRELLDKLNEGYDLVVGSRFLDGTKNISYINRMGNKIFSLFASYVGGIRITDSQSGFRAFRKDFFKEINPTSYGFEFETEVTMKALKKGYRLAEIPIEYRKRIGKSKLNPIADGLRIGKALVSMAYNETSLLSKTMLLPALIISALGGLFGVITLADFYNRLAFGNQIQHPYFPLLTILFIIIGIQLFSLGLIIDNITKKIDRIHELLRRKG